MYSLPATSGSDEHELAKIANAKMRMKMFCFKFIFYRLKIIIKNKFYRKGIFDFNS